MKRRNLVVLAVILVGVAGFVAFRPDKLFVDDRVDEDLASAFVTSTTEPDSTEPISTEPTTSLPAAGAATDTTEAASGSTSSSTATQPEPGPVQVSTGDFVGVDHSATGTAAIFEQNGTFVLRFEDDTDIQNGPDLFVWLVEGTDWSNPGEFLDLGKLKGNVGGQNYTLPAEYDPEIHRHVLIWCLRFAVPFAAAELS